MLWRNELTSTKVKASRNLSGGKHENNFKLFFIGKLFELLIIAVIPILFCISLIYLIWINTLHHAVPISYIIIDTKLRNIKYCTLAIK